MATNKEVLWRVNDANISAERLSKIYWDIQPFLENYDDTDDPIEGFYYYGVWEIEVLLMNLEEDIENNEDTEKIKERLDDILEQTNTLEIISQDINDELVDKNYHHEARVLINEPLNISSQINWIRNEIC